MDNGHPSWVAAFPRAINGVTPDNRGNAPCSGSTAPAPPRPIRKEYHNKNALSRQFRLFSSADDDFGNSNPDLPQKSAPTTPMPHPTGTIPPPYPISNPYPNRPRSVTRSTTPASKQCPNTSAILLPCRKSMGKVWEDKENAPEIRLFARFRSVGGDCWYSPICAFPIFAVRILPNPYQKPPPQALSATISLSRSSDAQESMGRCMGEHLRVDETL